MKLLKDAIDEKIEQLIEDYKESCNSYENSYYGEADQSVYNEAKTFLYWYNENLRYKKENGTPVYKLFEEEQQEIYDKMPEDYKIIRSQEEIDKSFELDPEAESKSKRRRISVWLYKYIDLKIQYNVLSNELKSYTDKASQITESINSVTDIVYINSLNSTAYNPEKWNEVVENTDSIIRYLNQLVTQLKTRLDKMMEAIGSVKNNKHKVLLEARYIRGLSSKQMREEYKLTNDAIKKRTREGLQDIVDSNIVTEEDLAGIKDPGKHVRLSQIRPGDKRFYDLMDRIKKNDKYLDELMELLNLKDLSTGEE